MYAQNQPFCATHCRQRGIAMLLTIVGVAMAFILSLSFLSAHALHLVGLPHTPIVAKPRAVRAQSSENLECVQETELIDDPLRPELGLMEVVR